MRKWTGLLAATAAISLAACDAATDPRASAADFSLGGALANAPAGYGDLTSSYVGRGAADEAGDSAGFVGGGRERHMGRGDMMGGGLHDYFLGGVGFGHGFAHEGPFGGGLRCDGTFDAATGRVTCAPDALRNGLTVTRSASYADASGAVQQAFDSATTNTVNLRNAVSGTLAFLPLAGMPGDHARPPLPGPGGPGDGGREGHHGRGERGGPGGPGGFRLLGDTAHVLSASITVDNASDRTVSGLAPGSAERTVNGVSRGSEVTVGTSTRGEFTATRTVADTVSGLVIPVQVEGGAYPTAGSVVRTMRATLTYAGQAPVSVSRREVVRYDGSATAQVTITEDGTTRSCTRALPRGPLACP